MHDQETRVACTTDGVDRAHSYSPASSSSVLAARRWRLGYLQPHRETLIRAARRTMHVLMPHITPTIKIIVGRGGGDEVHTSMRFILPPQRTRRVTARHDGTIPTLTPTIDTNNDNTDLESISSPYTHLLSTSSISPSPFSLRRSLRHTLRSFGLCQRPVLHSVFIGSRTPTDTCESLLRLATLGVTSVLAAYSFSMLVGRPLRWFGRLVTGRGGWSDSSADLEMVARINEIDPIRELATKISDMTIPARVGSYGLLIGGSVILTQVLVQTLETLGWISPQREGYSGIAASMNLAGHTIIGSSESSTLPPIEGRTAMDRVINLFSLYLTTIVSPMVEDEFLMPFLLGWSPHQLRDTVLGRMGLAAVWVGGWHQSVGRGSDKVISAGLRAAFCEGLLAIHPLLPTLMHVTMNYIAYDSYASISPLKGLRSVHMTRHASAEIDHANQVELYLELKHHFDPRHQQLQLNIIRSLRSIPFLRYVLPSTRHAMFRSEKTKKKPPSSSSSSSSSSWIFGDASGSNTLTLRYQKVVTELYDVLVSSSPSSPSSSSSSFDSSSSLSFKSFTFFFLLLPSSLEILRGAFKALDESLASDEWRRCVIECDRRRTAREKSDRATAEREGRQESKGERMAREKAYDNEIHEATLNTQPLECFVIHHTQGMPDDSDDSHDDRHRNGASHSLPFVCREWFSTHSSGASAPLASLLRRLTAQGAIVPDPRKHYSAPHEVSKSGWTSSGFLASFVQPAPEDVTMTPLPEDVRPRFRKLMELFQAYTEMMTLAAWDAHRQWYGETTRVTDESSSSPDSLDGDDEDAGSRCKYTRRFTHGSFVNWIRDLALQDPNGTDAILTQAVLILNGSMPHPMHIYNVALATFK